MISLNELQRKLFYEAETGCFYRIKRGIVGDIACTLTEAGRGRSLIITLNGGSSRIAGTKAAWMLKTGNFLPANQFVATVDGDRRNLAWANLELRTYSDAMIKVRAKSSKPSGRVGVHWSATNSKWVATFSCNGKEVRKKFQAEQLAEAISFRDSQEDAIMLHKLAMSGAWNG
jgi:hypothetical protein